MKKITVKTITDSHNRLIKGKCGLIKRIIFEATLEVLAEVQNVANN